jgi:type II secretory pathway component GspD/PulD (secretin)
MKTLRLLTLLLPLYLLGTHPSHSAEPGNRPIGLDYRGVPVSALFSTYRSLTPLELFIDSRACTNGTRVRLRTDRPVPRDQAMKLIERALLEQAGIVVTRLEDGRVSITYNDKLPLSSEGKKESR